MAIFKDTIRTLAGLGTTAALMGGAGGCLGIEYNLHPLTEPESNDYPAEGEAACLPEVVDGYVRVMGAGGEGGTAVELVEWGYRGHRNALMSTAMGAPEDGHGVVLVDFTDRSTGVLDPGTRERVQPFPFGNIARFGEALLAVDVRRGNESGDLDYGYGEEILVGAPGQPAEDQGGQGLLFVYRGVYDPVDLPTRFWERDTTYQPAGVPLSAEFGAAIAAPYDGGPGDYPDWIAVGAPGEDAVYLLEVDRSPTAASRFTEIQVLYPDPGDIGSRFGSALSVGDFDGDGQQDLAVGAPDRPAGGRVYLFSGNPAGCLAGEPLSADWLILESDLAGGYDQFGASMAAGRFFGSETGRVGLVVGVPSEDGLANNAGGICQFRIDPRGSTPWLDKGFGVCHDNPDPEVGSYFGASVAVGDFVPLDNLGSFTGRYARVDEIAVGRPYQDSDTVVDAGVVSIFEPGDDGLDLDAYPAPLTSLLDYSGDQTDGRFGASLARGFVQDTPFEDLVIGAPGAGSASATSHGSLSLTQSVLQSSTFPCSHLSGAYLGEDSVGHEVEASVYWASDELHMSVDVVDEFEPDGVTPAELTFEIRNDEEGDGGLCTLDVADFTGEIRGALELPAADWPCGTVIQTFAIYLGTFVGVDFYLDGSLTYDGVSETFTLYIDETNESFNTLNFFNPGDCHVVGNGFEFVMDTPFGCE